MLQHGFERAPVLSLQPLQLAQPDPDFLQPLRIEFDVGLVSLQKLGGLGCDDSRGVDLVEGVLKAGIDPHEIAQLVAQQGELIVYRLFAIVEQSVEAARRLKELLGILEHAPLGFQGFLLAALRTNAVDLLDLEAIELALLLHLLLPRSQVAAFPDEVGHLTIAASVIRPQFTEASKTVDQA